MKQTGLTIIHAAAVRDASGVHASPGAVVVQAGRVVFAGDLADVEPELQEQAEVVDRSGCLLLPGLINAHTHLELTAIGPKPYEAEQGFVGWVQMVREYPPSKADARQASARLGSDQCRDCGVQAVGDIAGSQVIVQAVFEGGLDGVGYLELFGLGSPYDRPAIEQIAQASRAYQPHAPYSAGPALYEAAARSGRPVSTHLAETQEESRFVAQGDGPWRDYLKSIGRWDDAFARHYGQGLSPVQWMRPYLERAAPDGGWLVAHCNYVSDRDITILADTNTSVAYCPIASEYFGHGMTSGGHRYRDMLAQGVNVCLGTDSIVCARPDDSQPLGLLSAMRRLYERDQTDPQTLLAMATINGARALRMDGSAATLQPGAPARFACIPIDVDSKTDPLIQVLTGQKQVEAIWFAM